MDPGNFFAELKRRNVYKVAVAYAVVGWLVMQVAATVVPALHLSDTITSAVVVLTLLGFPIALILAWAFELTPEGIKRAEDVPPSESITRKTGRKLTAVIVMVALIAAGLFAFQFLRGKSAATATAPAQPPVPAAASLEKSIAVLPFENLSDEKSNAYFAEGIQDEILTRLAKVADLKVISRTSTQRFKSAPSDLREIARQLGVANILEGSVQRTGDQVRVNVQLINAFTDAHLWAEIYDRKLTDIFAVESEIAKTIADTLQAQLSRSEKIAIAKRPTVNAAAYELYLKGRYFWNKRTGDDLKTALDYFIQAVAADPNYAAAYAGQADAALLIPIYSAGKPEEYFPKAKAAARRAIELDDSSAEGHTALGQLLCVDDLNFRESAREFERAIELNPNYATAHHWFSNGLLVAQGRFDEAIREARRAVELDPLSLIINADLGSTLIVARRYDEAIAQLRRTLALDNNFAYAHWNLGLAIYLKGDRPAGIAEFEKARAINPSPDVLGLLGRAYAEAGRKEEALQILKQLNETAQHGYVRHFLLALISIGLGDKASAIKSLEENYHHDNGDLLWLKVDPLLDPLRDDPRFKELVAKVFAEEK
jgi:TolB-like protein/Tfp pilus assembly protein PilF